MHAPKLYKIHNIPKELNMMKRVEQRKKKVTTKEYRQTTHIE